MYQYGSILFSVLIIISTILMLKKKNAIITLLGSNVIQPGQVKYIIKGTNGRYFVGFFFLGVFDAAVLNVCMNETCYKSALSAQID